MPLAQEVKYSIQVYYTVASDYLHCKLKGVGNRIDYSLTSFKAVSRRLDGWKS